MKNPPSVRRCSVAGTGAVAAILALLGCDNGSAVPRVFEADVVFALVAYVHTFRAIAPTLDCTEAVIRTEEEWWEFALLEAGGLEVGEDDSGMERAMPKVRSGFDPGK